MVSLEQIRHLESKVHAAVGRIKALAAENTTLKERLETYEKRISELQTLVAAFKADQEEIEAGILSALQHLDELEDTVSEQPAPGSGEQADATFAASTPTDPDAAVAGDLVGDDTAVTTEATDTSPAPEPASESSPASARDLPAGDPAPNVEPAPSSPEDDAPPEEEDEEPELDIF